MIIDTHTHIYLEEFDEDREAVIAGSKEAGVCAMYLPNVDTSTISKLKAVVKAHPDCCFPMMGIHPTSIGADYLDRLCEIKQELDSHPYCAVGEIGLDLYWDKTWITQQIDAFKTQIGWAVERDLPVSIHVRSAWEQTIASLASFDLNTLRGVFHCFSGGEQEAKWVVKNSNLSFGVGGTFTYKNASYPTLFREHVPLERVVVETDAPYLSPVPYRGKRNEPKYLAAVIEKLSEVYGRSSKEVEEIMFNNSRKLFLNKEYFPLSIKKC